MPVSKAFPAVSLIFFLALPALSNASIGDLPSTEHAIRIDGVLDDEAWKDAIRIDLNVETKPGENISARVRTIAYLIEDGDNLYVAFDAEDPDPTAISGVIVTTFTDAFAFFSFLGIATLLMDHAIF